MPAELKVKILYPLRFEKATLDELAKTKAFRQLITYKDWNLQECKECNAFGRRHLACHGCVRHLYTSNEYFICNEILSDSEDEYEGFESNFYSRDHRLMQ